MAAVGELAVKLLSRIIPQILSLVHKRSYAICRKRFQLRLSSFPYESNTYQFVDVKGHAFSLTRALDC